MTEPIPRVTVQLSPRDDAEIRAIISDVERGFNDNDVELSVAHFAEDAIVVTAVGVVLEGVAAIREATTLSLAGALAHATAYYEPFALAYVGSDVAVAQKRAWSSKKLAESGESAAEMTALYVLVRHGGRWWITRRENTLVARF
ncbi:SgcJ/EcaC family oxidoreductase [Rhodococcus sovatensis]|uniref:SgcJ/EcaC family oxidoreductase n=1 Tax=Rhodococcus sovatensis TaxID=1805840 RepID=A0ABZ2PNE7_9NOCA